MTNRERVLALIQRSPGLSDAEIRTRTGIEPNQQVNQICRRLTAQGRVDRHRRADGLIGNYPMRQDRRVGVSPVPAARRKPRLREQRNAHLAGPEIPVSLGSTLILIPCSSRKTQGGSTHRGGRRAIDLLPTEIAQRLRTSREAVAKRAGLDETRWLPAYLRYTGHLYRAAGIAVTTLLRAGAEVAIVSGGYGIILADEPIGTYEKEFKAGDWSSDIVSDAIPALATGLGKTDVIGLFATTTGYARVFRRVQWPSGVGARLVMPQKRAGGAMRAAPEAQGEMLAAFTTSLISEGWTSNRGLGADLEVLA